MAVAIWMPDFTAINPAFDKHVASWYDAMDWARLEVESDELKTAFVEWAIGSDFCTAEQLAKIPTWQFQTIGRVAYLLNKGAIAPEESYTFFMRKVAELKDILPSTETTVEALDSDEPTAKQKRVIEYVDLYSFIDAIRVKYPTDEATLEKLITERMRATNPNRQQLKKLYTHFKETLNDATAGMANPEVAKTVDALVSVVNVLAGFSGNAKVAGMQKKMTGRGVKAAAAVTVKSIDAATNIVSINPAMIPGSSVVVMYNTKTRKASIYAAKADTKLGIKGTKVTGFDEATSFAKTLRKPKMVLPGLREASNSKRVRVVLDQYVKGKSHTVNGRINKDMVIVKVFK